MTKEQALNTFWNGFGIPAYDANTVPDDAEMPYITYEASTGSIDDEIPLYASLWYRGMSWRPIGEKVDEINGYIGLGGSSQIYDGGRLWIKRGSPFSQRMSEPGDIATRRVVLNVLAEFQSG